MSLPAADELFRRTVPAQSGASASGGAEGPEGDAGRAPDQPPAPAQPSGRVRHDEKVTVYVTSEELLDLEHARLTLRRSGLSVDRGRLVREAVALALADLAEHGEDSAIVHRLQQA